MKTIILVGGRVTDLEDARAGDIIVYRHTENLTDYECCSATHKVIKATCTKHDSDGNCLKRKNTGHILFIIDKPRKSTKCKDNDDDKKHCSDSTGDYQWLVPVADSTTSKHSKDSRAPNKTGDSENKSTYCLNTYHAWTKGDTNTTHDLERCDDNISFHRDCSSSDYNLTSIETILINTIHNRNATGVGAGRIYVNDDMDGFRSRYGSEIEKAELFIGRVAKCDQ
ncbi:MAG: hypothetical protein U9P72_06495 [Campylobacterota bacterium]|nr:hypothetical protein [Campylobacterota bacterium]